VKIGKKSRERMTGLTVQERQGDSIQRKEEEKKERRREMIRGLATLLKKGGTKQNE